MSRGPATFRQSDVTRALKAAVAAGMKVARAEVDHGKIVLLFGDGKAQTKPENEWDRAVET